MQEQEIGFETLWRVHDHFLRCDHECDDIGMRVSTYFKYFWLYVIASMDVSVCVCARVCVCVCVCVCRGNRAQIK